MSTLRDRRLLAVVLAGVLALAIGLAACGGGDDDTSAEPSETATEEPTDFTGEAEPVEAETSPEDTVTTETETTPQATVTITVKGKNLQTGMSNKRVTQLQRALIAIGLLEEGSDDGDFGAGTKRAVQAFQLEKGLKANGVANKKTIRQINAAVKKGDRFDDFDSSGTSTSDDGSSTDDSGDSSEEDAGDDSSSGDSG